MTELNDTHRAQLQDKQINYGITCAKAPMRFQWILSSAPNRLRKANLDHNKQELRMDPKQSCMNDLGMTNNAL